MLIFYLRYASFGSDIIRHVYDFVRFTTTGNTTNFNIKMTHFNI